MVIGRKSKFSFFKNFGWKLILSLIIAGGAAYLLKELFYPCQLNLLETINDYTKKFIIYHDFNDDGLSEYVELNNLGPNKNYIHIKSWTSGIIDQTNYWESVSTGLMFADITGDRYDEIIACTQKDDSVYLYVHDIISKKPIVKRLFLSRLQEPITQNYRQADFLPGLIADSTIYEEKVIIFGLRSFSALKPRSIFALNIDKQKIINEFETHSTLGQIFTFDLTGDGIDEIIVFGVAYGNVPYPAQYRDDKCWLFVLDQKLDPIFLPLSFSEYPSEFGCFPVENHSDKFLLVVPDYIGEKNLHDYIYLIDANGKIHLRIKSPFNNFHEAGPVITYLKNPTEIYGVNGNNELIKLNENLEVVGLIFTPFNRIMTNCTKDLNADGKEELLCTSDNFLAIYDDNLKLLAKLPITNRYLQLTFKETGPNKPIEIGIGMNNKFYLYSFTENKLYSYFPLLFAGLTGIIFLFLTGSQKIISAKVNHSRILKYLSTDSSDGILLVDNQCQIIFFNDSLVQMLNLQHPPLKGNNAVSILNHYLQIREIINKSRESGDQIIQQILISNQQSEVECEVSVQPYKSLFNKGFHFLIVLKPVNMQSHSDKIHTWSRAVQKMAHDIKTPLSTVSLNLKVLQTRLEKIQLSETEKNELSDDIKMMRTELDHIQTMTKNFLKFSNLDKPHFQAFNINPIIEEARSKFQPYLNADLSIEISIDKDVKPVWADPQQIEMVLTILFENSLAAMHGKGLINVNVSTVQYLENIFSESIEVEVADTGPGINEEDKKRIFEPYFSTKSEGTGMGLAIAKKIINDNGGSIEVHSKPNFGAVFRFSIPSMKEEENE